MSGNQDSARQKERQTSEQPQHVEQQSPTDIFRNNLSNGVIPGAVIYLLGVIAHYLFYFNIDGVEESAEFANWKIAGLNYYNAHSVDTSITSRGEAEMYNIFEADDVAAFSEFTSTVPEIGYQLVPVVALLIGGFWMYKQYGDGLTTNTEAAALGAAITSGYVALGVVGWFLFELSAEEFHAQSELVPTIIILGIAYPVICGGIGGILAHVKIR